jgi:type III pantothenate kinase
MYILQLILSFTILPFKINLLKIPKMRKTKIFLIDIGNSFCAFCELTDAGKFSKKNQIPTKNLTHECVQEFFSEALCYIASVVPNKDALFKALKSSQCIFINHHIAMPLKVNLASPEDVGADRLMTALGAYHVYGCPALVIDSGTALTFCFVNQNGVYEGGAIFPGMRLCSWALNDQTAKLPLVWVEPKESLYGKNTEDAIKAGLYHGFFGLIESMIKQYRQTYTDIVVVGTGSGLAVFKDKLSLDVLDDELIFHGLKYIALNH